MKYVLIEAELLDGESHFYIGVYDKKPERRYSDYKLDKKSIEVKDTELYSNSPYPIEEMINFDELFSVLKKD